MPAPSPNWTGDESQLPHWPTATFSTSAADAIDPPTATTASVIATQVTNRPFMATSPPNLLRRDVRRLDHFTPLSPFGLALAGDRTGDRRCSAAIGHVGDLDVRRDHQHRETEVPGGADPGRAEVDLAGLRLRQRDELLERFGFDLRIDLHQHRHVGDVGHRN